MYISQTFLQVPAAWQLSHNVLLLKMFIANYSWTCHGKAISSMLPLNEITPAISSLGARGEFEEMIATEEPFVIIIAVVTAKNGTMFTSFLWRRHNPIKYQRNDKNSEEKQGKASFVLINTPRGKIRLNASLDVLSAWLLFQDGAGNCKKGYWTTFPSSGISQWYWLNTSIRDGTYLNAFPFHLTGILSMLTESSWLWIWTVPACTGFKAALFWSRTFSRWCRRDLPSTALTSLSSLPLQTSFKWW